MSFYSFLSNKFEEQNDRIIVIDQREKIMENGWLLFSPPRQIDDECHKQNKIG